MKTCSRCNTNKPLAEFNRSGGTKDGLHTYCGVCQSEHYKSRKDIQLGHKSKGAFVAKQDKAPVF